MNQAAIYARYSSDKQSETSSQAQIRAAEAYCASKNYTVVKIYTDEAKSAKTDDRPAFQQMIADAKNKLFNILIVHKIDRFSRNRYDSAIYKRALQRANVTIEYVEQHIDGSPESIMMESMLEGMAEYYSANLAKETMKGLNERAFSAKFNGGTPPLGYDIVNEQYVINENESKAIKIIFEMFANGYGYNKISDELSRLGYRTKRGSCFGKNSLHELLKNEKYIGTYIFNKVKKTKDGKRNTHKANNEAIKIPNVLPAIIDMSTWKKIRIMMDKNKHAPGTHRAKETYLLTGLLECETCGMKLIGNRVVKKSGEIYAYYVCGKNDRHSGKCPTPNIPKDLLERNVLDELYDALFSPKAISARTMEINNIVKKASASIGAEFSSLQKEEKSTINKMDNLYSLVEEGQADEYDKERLARTKLRLTQIRVRIQELHNKASQQLFTESQIREILSKYAEDIKEKDSDKIRALLSTFVDKIVITKSESIIVHLKMVGFLMVPRTGIEPVRRSLSEGF